jgi:hypothetical protein
MALRVPDIAGIVEQLTVRGIQAQPLPPLVEDGRTVHKLAWLPVQEQGATDLVLIDKFLDPQYAPVAPAFPLKLLDHLAAVAHDMDAKTRFWTGVLGLPVAGQVTTPAMVIRQFWIGDAVMELAGAAFCRQPSLSAAAGQHGCM